jgi:hypothetical protein
MAARAEVQNWQFSSGLGRLGQEKDVILKNEPKKSCKYNKKLHA